MNSEPGREGGLLASLRKLLATLIGTVSTRLELLATEFEEERAWFANALWLAMIGGLCLTASAVLIVLFLIVAFWDTHRLLVIGLLVAAFALSGIGALMALRQMVHHRKPLFAQTRAELRADRTRLDSE